MRSTVEGDRLARSTRTWRLLAIAALAVACAAVLLGFGGVIPFGLGLIVFGVSVLGVMAIAIQEQRRLEQAFLRLVREPTWAAVSDGQVDAPHEGRLWTFSGEGRLADRWQARPDLLMIAFDDAAFVVVARGPILSPLRRHVLRKGDSVDFEVRVSTTGGCILDERASGLHARLTGGSTGHPPEGDVPRIAGDQPDVAARVGRALTAAGWT